MSSYLQQQLQQFFVSMGSNLGADYDHINELKEAPALKKDHRGKKSEKAQLKRIISTKGPDAPMH
ncbi:MAG: hypothetical protein COB04_08795 [Gammaproteobacteria bacterium]|nr:MAG: hypothetical protein COB04_08795 [Gammaproteobacteria bacterium]